MRCGKGIDFCRSESEFRETYKAAQEEHKRQMKTYSTQKADLPVVPEASTPTKLTPQLHTSGGQNTKAIDATLKDATPKEATPTPEEQDECSVREHS